MEEIIITNKLEIVNFYQDKLYCPVINGEPYTIVNTIVKSLGVNYSNTMEKLRSHSRFGEIIGTLQVKRERRGKNQYGATHISFTQKDEILQFSDHNSGVWQVIYEQIKGYKYTVIPVRKIAGWLYSISVDKVKPAAKPSLERYQNECDDVLFMHFFGKMAMRKQLMVRKQENTQRKMELLEQLRGIPIFNEYIKCQVEEMKIGTLTKKLDKEMFSNEMFLQ